MDTEIKDTVENDGLSLPKSLEVDEIIEFYKDKASETELTETIPEPESETESPRRKNFFRFSKKKQETTPSDDDIVTSVYGLSEKGRIYLYRGISLTISVCIIVASFFLAYFLPGNEAIITERQDKLRSEEGYANLKSRYTTLKSEVSELRKSNKEKKEQVDQISDFDNTKSELRTDITAKQYELNELNTQIEEKRTTIAELDTSIAEKAPPENILPPGKYVVGKNIASGKYTVTGTGKFMVASSDGKSKLNTTLGSTPIEVTLDANDIIKFDSKVKFTSTN